MILKDSFQIELPPYTQDLADAGKGASDGYAFINSYNVEMATGGIEQGKPPLEVGASQLDFDYLHIINWKKAEEVVAAGKFTELNGIRVISLETAIAEGLLILAPEPRSPHGVDIAPERRLHHRLGQARPARDRLRLRPHQEGDRRRRTTKARIATAFPILKFDAVVAGKVELGAGSAAHAVRQQGQRLHEPVSRERGREVDARRAVSPGRQGVQARRQGLDPLQHRPPRDRRRATRWTRRAST